MSDLVQRRIDATISLAKGRFGDEVGDTITVSGLRTSASIVSVGGEAMGTAEIRIFGLPLSVMNKLTSIGLVMTEWRMQNKISISAGNDGDALTTVFSGVIDNAYADLNSAPDVALVIVGRAGLSEALKPVAASSFFGSADVATIMSQFAKQAGYAFVNEGVKAVLSNPYFPGTLLEQIKSCARAARVEYDIKNDTLYIRPAGGSASDPEIKLSPQTGLIGYPILNSKLIVLRSLFIPNARISQKVTVSGSEIESANRTYTVRKVIHNLESLTPRGLWFTELQASTYVD